MSISLTWPQVLAWRLERQFAGGTGSDAVSVVRRLCGVQSQVASAADLAIAVRQAGPRPGEIETALWRERTLRKAWLMRGTLHLVPADELPMYCGALGSLRFWEKGSWQRGHGVTAAEIEAIVDTVPRVLGERALTRDELVEAVIESTGDAHLREALTSGWGMLLKPLSFLGELCYGQPREGRVTFTAPGIVPLPVAEAGTRLVRSFLGAHGPATPEMFDTWLFRGKSSKPVLRGWFHDLGPDVTEVEVEGRPMPALTEQVEALAATRPSDSVRLLPGFDQYVMGAPRDLEPLLPRAAKPKVSRAAGWISPVVVFQGRVAGVWEAKDGEIALDLFEDVPAAALSRETERVAALLAAAK